MPSRDADINRLMDKYGASPLRSSNKSNGVPSLRIDKNRWLETTKDFYRWKKTDEYQKWRKKQFAKQEAKCYYCNVNLVGMLSLIHI